MPPTAQTTQPTIRNQKSEIQKAMEKKESSIEKFQGSKEKSMKIMSSGRDAVLIATAKLQHQNMTDEEIQAEVKKWATWIYTSIYDSPFI